LKSWDVLIAPGSDPEVGVAIPRLDVQPRISINVLMLDPKLVVVERTQRSLIQSLKEWGFEPIPCAFLSYAVFGGSFHCATLDVSRRGTLESYF
jgi:glycine amidinotransferase